MKLPIKAASACLAVLLACHAAFAEEMPAGMHGSAMMAAMHGAMGQAASDMPGATVKEVGGRWWLRRFVIQACPGCYVL
jgi:hypothetical protein